MWAAPAAAHIDFPGQGNGDLTAGPPGAWARPGQRHLPLPHAGPAPAGAGGLPGVSLGLSPLPPAGELCRP
eukprot:5361310-Lingulodinium_polyedra.AAC.1